MCAAAGWVRGRRTSEAATASVAPGRCQGPIRAPRRAARASRSTVRSADPRGLEGSARPVGGVSGRTKAALPVSALFALAYGVRRLVHGEYTELDVGANEPAAGEDT